MATQSKASDDSQSLKGREIIVAVCGGIAAYKSAQIVSSLVQLGAGVTVAMTPDAQKFVTPLTFQALSARPVRTDTFDLVESSDPQHIALTERADLMLIAPTTANMIAKIAHGLCDDIVSLMVNAAACPVVFAPAMNNRMWENPITRENVDKLTKLGYRFIGPDDGWLACRNVGRGRMSQPDHIVEQIQVMLERSGAPVANPTPAPYSIQMTSAEPKPAPTLAYASSDPAPPVPVLACAQGFTGTALLVGVGGMNLYLALAPGKTDPDLYGWITLLEFALCGYGFAALSISLYFRIRRARAACRGSWLWFSAFGAVWGFLPLLSVLLQEHHWHAEDSAFSFLGLLFPIALPILLIRRIVPRDRLS